MAQIECKFVGIPQGQSPLMALYRLLFRPALSGLTDFATEHRRVKGPGSNYSSQTQLFLPVDGVPGNIIL